MDSKNFYDENGNELIHLGSISKEKINTIIEERMEEIRKNNEELLGHLQKIKDKEINSIKRSYQSIYRANGYPKKVPRPNIEFFIKKFKENYPKELEYVFTHGNCFFFALILKHIYPEGTIQCNVNHFVFKLNDKLYDITGDVTEKYKNTSFVLWDILSITDFSLFSSMVRDCIYHLDPEG